jgi:hypothetical protein
MGFQTAFGCFLDKQDDLVQSQNCQGRRLVF